MPCHRACTPENQPHETLLPTAADTTLTFSSRFQSTRSEVSSASNPHSVPSTTDAIISYAADADPVDVNGPVTCTTTTHVVASDNPCRLILSEICHQSRATVKPLTLLPIDRQCMISLCTVFVIALPPDHANSAWCIAIRSCCLDASCGLATLEKMT
jgi:hypothetical protein